MLDAGSLAVLGSHFERLMGAIEGRVDSVKSPQRAPSASKRRCWIWVKMADADNYHLFPRG